MTVRTRIAPSPTGDPHVGTAYIALFNLCYARQFGGQFILRIEDTDKVRSTDRSENDILQAMRWLGLEWDEGPDVGGPVGPYRQSERKDIYQKYAMQLVAAGHAFYCFRTPEELEQIRQQRKAQGLNPGIRGQLELPPEEVEQRLQEGQPYVIRMKVPDQGQCLVDDMLRGKIEIDWAQVDCQILLKSDGLPTYHLANVVDDHLMNITHVIRGEEWINSAPKHQLLYSYFGWEMPKLCHMPLLRNPDKSKLSKRKNPTSINFYQSLGVMPEALLNYLGRMGWSMPDEREKFNLAEMIEHFDITRVSLGGPIFDLVKLRWLNSLWIREGLTDAEFVARVEQWGFGISHYEALLGQIKNRIDLFSDIAPMTTFLRSGYLALTEADFAKGKLPLEEQKRVLQFVLWKYEQETDWRKEVLFTCAKDFAGKMQIKMGDFMYPIFVAIAGSPNSWSVMESLAFIGPDMSRMRLREAVTCLGGFSKKAMKRVEKEFAALDTTSNGEPAT